MKRPAVLLLAAAIALGGVFGGLVAFGVFGRGPSGSSTPQQEIRSGLAVPHQTMIALATDEQATANARPTATSTLTPQERTDRIRAQALADPRVARSCPQELPMLGVFPRNPIFQPDPDFKQGAETSTAFAVGSNGIGYALVAGSPSYQPEHWIVLARPVVPDPCATMLGLAPDVATRSYDVAPGPVTLTQIDRDSIIFTTGDGKTARLNFVTGTFE